MLPNFNEKLAIDLKVWDENTELITDVPEVATGEDNSLEEKTVGSSNNTQETVGPWDNLQETSEENPVDASEEVGYQVEQIQEGLDDTREVVTLEGRRKRAKENPNSRQVKLKRPKSYKPTRSTQSMWWR